jgi:hypothetical protein
MNDPKNFSQLNLVELERLASTWAEEYPIIEKITLYPGKISPNSGKEPKTHYVYIVRICSPPHRKDPVYQNTLKVAGNAEIVLYWTWRNTQKK